MSAGIRADASGTKGHFQINGNDSFTVMSDGSIRLIPQGTAPTSPVEGQIYFNSGDNKLKCWDGTSWKDLF